MGNDAMKKMHKPLIIAPLAVAVSLAAAQTYAESNTITDAIKNGKASLNLRLRYEDVNQDTAGSDLEATATTLKTSLTLNSSLERAKPSSQYFLA